MPTAVRVGMFEHGLYIHMATLNRCGAPFLTQRRVGGLRPNRASSYRATGRPTIRAISRTAAVATSWAWAVKNPIPPEYNPRVS